MKSVDSIKKYRTQKQKNKKRMHCFTQPATHQEFRDNKNCIHAIGLPRRTQFIQIQLSASDFYKNENIKCIFSRDMTWHDIRFIYTQSIYIIHKTIYLIINHLSYTQKLSILYTKASFSETKTIYLIHKNYLSQKQNKTVYLRNKQRIYFTNKPSIW